LYSRGAHLGTGRYEIGNPDLANEIGYGADLFGRFGGERLTLELAGFVTRIDHFVILRPTGDSDPASGFPVHVYEADGARLAGGEVNLEARLGTRLQLRGGADVVRGSRRDADRTPLPYMPPARTVLGAEYDAGAWWIGALGRGAAAQRRVAHEGPTSAYAILDVQAGLRLPARGDRRTLVLRVDNLLDTAYRDHLSRVEDRRFPMPGRNVSVSLRWRF
jgi:iron complex outermembrane recepter protein